MSNDDDTKVLYEKLEACIRMARMHKVKLWWNRFIRGKCSQGYDLTREECKKQHPLPLPEPWTVHVATEEPDVGRTFYWHPETGATWDKPADGSQCWRMSSEEDAASLLKQLEEGLANYRCNERRRLLEKLEAERRRLLDAKPDKALWIPAPVFIVGGVILALVAAVVGVYLCSGKSNPQPPAPVYDIEAPFDAEGP